jgi:BNR repeat-like domain
MLDQCFFMPYHVRNKLLFWRTLRCQLRSIGMKLINQSVICAGAAGTSRANCCFPSIARLADGTFLATWRVGSRKDSADGVLMLSGSRDEGRTWSAAQEMPLGRYADLAGEVHYGPLTVLGPGHVLAALMWVDRSDPELPLFHPTTEGLLPIRTLFCESGDDGRSWSDYREMDTAPYDSPMPITGPVLQLPDERLACQFEVNKHYEETQPWRHAAAWKISSDGGGTWPECVEIAHDPTGRLMYWDARYAVRADGFCVAAFWTYDRQAERDATIHLSISRDGGRQWSAPKDVGIVGQICQPLFVDDGRLLLVYVDRFASRSIRAVLTDDLGETFSGETVVYEHPRAHVAEGHSNNTADYLQEMDVWTFGRVEGLASEGVVSLVYYAGNEAATSINFSQLSLRAADARRREGQDSLRQWEAQRTEPAKSV